MKTKSLHLFIVAVLALLCPLAQNGRCDFILWNDEQLTVNSYHYQGTLYDTSCAFIVSGGQVHKLYAYDSSTANISDGHTETLYAYSSSTVNVSGGGNDADPYSLLTNLYAYDTSTANFFSGPVNCFEVQNTSTANKIGRAHV